MESEVRLHFPDPKQAFQQLISKAQVTQEYESEDIFYQPLGLSWPFSEKNMRLRVGLKGPLLGQTFLIYRENTWQGDVKVENLGLKVPLQTAQEGEHLLQSWNFKEILRYKKVGKVFKVQGMLEGFVWEDIEHLGPTVEVEASNQDKVELILGKVFNDMDYKLLQKTVPELVMEKIKNGG